MPGPRTGGIRPHNEEKPRPTSTDTGRDLSGRRAIAGGIRSGKRETIKKEESGSNKPVLEEEIKVLMRPLLLMSFSGERAWVQETVAEYVRSKLRELGEEIKKNYDNPGALADIDAAVEAVCRKESDAQA